MILLEMWCPFHKGTEQPGLEYISRAWKEGRGGGREGGGEGGKEGVGVREGKKEDGRHEGREHSKEGRR